MSPNKCPPLITLPLSHLYIEYPWKGPPPLRHFIEPQIVGDVARLPLSCGRGRDEFVLWESTLQRILYRWFVYYGLAVYVTVTMRRWQKVGKDNRIPFGSLNKWIAGEKSARARMVRDEMWYFTHARFGRLIGIKCVSPIHKKYIFAIARHSDTVSSKRK